MYEFTILRICKLLLDKKAIWNKYKQEKGDKIDKSESGNSDDDESDDDDDDDGNDIASCSWMSYHYALMVNLKNHIDHVNTHVVAFVKHLLELCENDLDVFHFIKYSEYYIEKITCAQNIKTLDYTNTKNKYSRIAKYQIQSLFYILHQQELEKRSHQSVYLKNTK